MSRGYSTLFKRYTLITVSILLLFPSVAGAFDLNFASGNNVIFSDPDASGSACSSSSGGLGTSSSSSIPGSYTHDQEKVFASEPVNSTWNISDTTVEQWFLKQGSARATVQKYNLTSSNIGAITSAVKAQNVSPAFFYLYTVNEGGGAGGFINHFQSESAGGGVGNATADAKYIYQYSNKSDLTPGWTDAGNYVDFVPQSVKTAGDADYKSFPLGTIGKIYIPATAATTWAYYYPDGLKKSFNKIQDYGDTFNAMMQNIKKLGGDPFKGGSAVVSSGCANGVTGEGMAKAISFAEAIAANDGYGYDQDTRTSGWVKWQAEPNCNHACGSFDCSSFISAILTVGGYFKTNPNFSTLNEATELKGAGFTQVTPVPTTKPVGLIAGDVLIKDGHTEMYIGNNQNVSASKNENNGINGGQIGDQTGQEIWTKPYYDGNWTSVWRAPK